MFLFYIHLNDEFGRSIYFFTCLYIKLLNVCLSFYAVIEYCMQSIYFRHIYPPFELNPTWLYLVLFAHMKVLNEIPENKKNKLLISLSVGLVV